MAAFVTARRIPVIVIVYLACCCYIVRTNPVAANKQQSLQEVLYSIEERLRGLDLLYAPPRYTQPRHWDTEEYTRRLDAIEARSGRIEALLELRLDKIIEAISSNQMKQSLASDQMNRKIDSLYDRLNHRMGFTENRLDLNVAKLRSSIESGFARMVRDPENCVDADVETQLQELQRQFDGFETNQNATLSTLLEITNKSCLNYEMNDAETGGREVDKKDLEQFAQSMDSVATKVNKMVTDFSLRTQVMESLVKNSMSLSNATRRELQDGLRSLGLRIVYQGNKHNKDKEISYEFGWDALASLITKEFGNLAVQLQTNQDKLVTAQDGFRQSCHRLQETEQQLSSTVAHVLDNMLDLIRNRSTDMSKQMATFQEILKNHNSQMLRMTNRTHARQLEALPSDTLGSGQQKAWEKLQDGMINILAGIQVIQDQINEMSNVHLAPEDMKEGCPESSGTADKTSPTITSKQINASNNEMNIDVINRLMDKVLAAINITQSNDRSKLQSLNSGTSDEDRHRNEGKDNRVGNKEGRDSHVLDIIEEDLGETLQYNVTRDDATLTDRDTNDNITEEINDYEHSSSEMDKTEHQYYDEVEGNVDDEHLQVMSRNRSLRTSMRHNTSRIIPHSENPNRMEEKISGGEDGQESKGSFNLNQMAAIQSSSQNKEYTSTSVKKSTPAAGFETTRGESGINLNLKPPQEQRHSEETSISGHSDIQQNTRKTLINKNEEINPPIFSHLWQKIKNQTTNHTSEGNTNDLSNPSGDVELTKGHDENVNNSTLNVTKDPKAALQGRSDEETRKLDAFTASGNQDFKFLDRIQINHDDNDEYDYDK